MECWATYQRTIQENQRLSFSFLNFLQDEMAFVAGLPSIGPRIQVPVPTYIKNAPITMKTTNNIHVESGSQVGQINAGALVYIDRAVTTFNGVGGHEFAAALQAFTQATIDNKELSTDAQREILNLLRALVEQVSKAKEERNASVARLAINNIGALVNAATALGTHWEKLKTFLEHLVR
jgi:hypothetical protein